MPCSISPSQSATPRLKYMPSSEVKVSMYYHMTTVRPVGKGTPLPGYTKRETWRRTVSDLSGIMSATPLWTCFTMQSSMPPSSQQDCARRRVVFSGFSTLHSKETCPEDEILQSHSYLSWLCVLGPEGEGSGDRSCKLIRHGESCVHVICASFCTKDLVEPHGGSPRHNGILLVCRVSRC